MNKFKDFKLILDNSSGTYNAGETITGFVLVDLKKTIKLRGIFIKLTGKGDVNWEENEIRIGYNPTYYSNNETYIDSMVILYGKGPNSSEQTELQEGEHRLPFKINLPVNIPTSFEHKYGNIRYFLKAVINKPWALDKSCKFPLQIKSLYDLNTQPEAKVPLQKNKAETFGCFSCRSGSLTATIHLKQTGFVPGEKIQIHVEIDNFTDQPITYTKMAIKMVSQKFCNIMGHACLCCMYHITEADQAMKTRLHTSTKTKIKSAILVSVLGRSIKPGSSATWSDKSLQIPPQTTPQLIYCSIIDIEYTFTFSLCSFWRTLLEIPVKILIGTVPVRKQPPQRLRMTTD